MDCVYDTFTKFNIYISELILDRYEYTEVAHITLHCIEYLTLIEMTVTRSVDTGGFLIIYIFQRSYEMNISLVKEFPRLYLTEYYSFNLKNKYTSK